MRTLWFDTALVDGVWADRVRLEISDGVIAEIRTGVAAEPSDERHAIGLPGLPNLHSHAFQRGMAGLAEARGPAGDDFWSWRELMYRFLDRLGPDDVEAIAAQAYAEMLGVSDYLRKPFAMDVMLEAIERALTGGEATGGEETDAAPAKKKAARKKAD